MRLDRRPTQLPVVIEAAVETVQPAAEGKNIDIRLDLDRTIGPILVDPDRMQQVVWNLLSNAIKFSPAGTSVSVTLRRDENRAVVEICDEGPGIAREFLPYLFERFRQADSSSKRSHSGLGLGLSLTKNLTELHGGTIEVESDVGRGALFRVSLPFSGGEVAHEVRMPDDRVPSQDTRLRGIRVLVVDDSADVRLMFQTLLQNSGAKVSTAASVDEALASLRLNSSDIVITDVAMPLRDGYDLLREVRASVGELSGLPVMALTAQARSEDEDRARVAGFQSYLRKPVDAEQLVREVARHARAPRPASGN
jgi:CheY-like chemotaxis protein